jgi:molecular chaperone DnaK
MPQVVGIDLGTTNTVVATLHEGIPRIITDQGRPLIPSVAWFSGAGKVVVGEEARARRVLDPTDTVFSVKRLIGRSWDSSEVQQARQRFPFELREGPGKATLVAAGGQTFTLPEISAFVLRKAKQVAETTLGTRVERAVITVPANFNDLQRAATKVAGRVAGLDVMRLLNEPTAAALAYGLGRTGHERIAVYDFGGGTFDVTLLDLNGKVVEVLSTAGDTFLGGDDVDAAIADRMADLIQQKHGFDPRGSTVSRERMRAAAERVKMVLSEQEKFEQHLPDLANKEAGKWYGIDFSFSRSELEESLVPLISSTLDVCQQALGFAGLAATDLSQVLLVGGSTRVPLVKRMVEQFFGVPVRESPDPDQVVALGAAVQAAALEGSRGSNAPESRRSGLPPGPARGPSMFPNERDRISSIPGGTPPSVPAIPELFGTPQPSGKSRPPRPPPARKVPPPERRAPRALRKSEVTSADDNWSAGPLLDIDLAPDPSVDTAVPELHRGVPGLSVPPQNRNESVFTPLPSESGFTPLPSEAGFTPLPSSPGAGFASLPSKESVKPPPSVSPPLLVDVTPLSLSVETVGGYCDKLITRNSPVPTEESRVFITTQDNQTKVVVRVCQGESKMFAENTHLGEVELTDLEPKPRGKSQVRIHFELDADGMLQVGATDLGTNRQARVRLRLLGITDATNIAALAARQAEHAVS